MSSLDLARAALEKARGVLQAERSSACLLDGEGTILDCNAAWDLFAVENQGAPAALARAVVGRPWLSFLSGKAVVAGHRAVLERAFGGSPWRIDGECNTPTTARRLTTAFQPVRLGGDGEVIGLALIHFVTRSAPIGEFYRLAPLELPRHLGPDGLVHMCACCRRVRVVTGSAPERWIFVPELVAARPQNLTHGYCDTCYGLQFPGE